MKKHWFNLIAFTILSSTFLWSSSSEAANIVSWNFNAAEQLKEWRGEGIETAGIYQGTFRVMGREQFQLTSPPNLKISPQEDPYLRVRFRSQSPRYLRVFWHPRAGNPVLVPEVVV